MIGAERRPHSSDTLERGCFERATDCAWVRRRVSRGMPGFHLCARVAPSLPKLAWCAHVRANTGAVVVRHGSDVEVGDAALVEGAWDGPFAEMAFDGALLLAGTGVAVRGERLRFVAGSERTHRLYAARRGDDLYVSNSLTFTLVAAGEKLDPSVRDLAGHIRRQIRSPRYDHTAHSLGFPHGPVEIFEMRDLVVDRSLRMTSVPKRTAATVTRYDELVALLDRVMARTFANAADPARRARYTPLATLSRGYDAAAMAVLAVRNGCREAVTFAESMPGVADPTDDGAAIGARLGLVVLRRARHAWFLRDDLPEAEMCATPPAKALPFASIQDELAGRLLVTGKFGNQVFGHARPTKPSQGRANAWTSSCSVAELRLRVGFIYCSPLFVLRPLLGAMRALSESAELTRYRVGGDYDRPIPRRMVEEAGVERAEFGWVRRAGAFADVRWAEQLGPVSRRDFEAFVAARSDLPSVATMPLRARLNGGLLRAYGLADRGLRRLGAPRLPHPGTWPLQDDPRLFHWGFERTRGRYR